MVKVGKKAENSEDQDRAWVVFAVLAAVVVALMVGAYFWIWSLVPAGKWGTFADVYGAVVGTLFSGLAFAGLILAVHLQRRELRETREELAKTATAQVESQKAHEAHVEVAQQSARLSAATALLNHYQAILPRLRTDAQPAMGGGAAVRERLEQVLGEVPELETEIQVLRGELRDAVRRAEGMASDV